MVDPMTNALVDIHGLPLGELQTNCYAIALHDGDACWVFAPGGRIAPLMRLLTRKRRKVTRILITHGHGDHIGGVGELKKEFPEAIFTVPARDEYMLADPIANVSGLFGASVTAPAADVLIHPGDRFTFGPTVWDVLDTSGHTAGGVTYYCREAAVAVVGDTLFAQGVGRTDLPGGNHEIFMANIRANLLTLPDETHVLPGHGPTTTIGREKQVNPFL